MNRSFVWAARIIVHDMRMKTIIWLIATIAVMVLSHDLYAQDDYGFYLQKAQQRLAEGDCDGAQRNYNVYKELTGMGDADLESGINECQERKDEETQQNLELKTQYEIVKNEINKLLDAEAKNVCYDLNMNLPLTVIYKNELLKEAAIAYDNKNSARLGEINRAINKCVKEQQTDRKSDQQPATPQTRTIPQGYVDLGLPSGTLWKSYNESGFYSYQQAVNKFGSNLPTRDQFEELINNCTWVWNGAGYRITGSNGNSIFLPAAGGRTKNRGDVKDVGTVGHYWSSVSKNSEDAYILAISATYNFTLNHLKKHGFSVRLVWY